MVKGKERHPLPLLSHLFEVIKECLRKCQSNFSNNINYYGLEGNYEKAVKRIPSPCAASSILAGDTNDLK
jgi:arginine decarboxylase-like protein